MASRTSLSTQVAPRPTVYLPPSTVTPLLACCPFQLTVICSPWSFSSQAFNPHPIALSVPICSRDFSPFCCFAPPDLQRWLRFVPFHILPRLLVQAARFRACYFARAFMSPLTITSEPLLFPNRPLLPHPLPRPRTAGLRFDAFSAPLRYDGALL